ncbi:hypothetical protein LQW54_004703 [Pestalotiopsis sp. IQ-011]
MEGGSSRDRSVSAGPEPQSATSEKHPAPGSIGTSESAVNKRRRGLGVVTPNACTECRKKRAKSKENLRSEIDQLRKQQRQNDSVLTALVKPELWEEVLTRIRSGQSVEGISEWLGGSLPSGGGAQPTFSPRSGLPPPRPTLPPLSGITTDLNFGGNPNNALPGGYGPLSVGPQYAQKNNDYDHNSPWAFSSQSQTQSTRSSSHPDVMNWTSDAPSQNRVGSWVLDQSSPYDSGRYRGMDQILAPLDSPGMKSPPTTWTAITADSSLVQHLLALYFCWEYPTFASLSKEHFLKDFLDGRSRYCSPILVNALLALGCRFSTQPNTRANANDPTTSGDHFFAEALRLFAKETNHHNLTTIQALGIMAIREASCGRDSESWYYAGQSVRMAIELGLHRLSGDGDTDELAVQAATFWGAFALDHAWSLATGSLPQCSCFPHLPPKPAIIDDIEASLWVPYTDNGPDVLGAPLQRSCEQPSNVRSVYTCFCELSELVHKSLYVLHSPGKPVTSRDLLNTYTQYLNWYDRIPEVLRLGTNFTPAVLFAHMYYHFAILLLFRPLIKLRIIGSSVTPRDVCAQAADAIQGLSKSYSQLYTLRRTPSFVPYFVLTAAIMHLAVGGLHPPAPADTPGSESIRPTAKPEESANHAPPRRSSSSTAGPPSPSSTSTAKMSPRAVSAINQGIADLTEMAPCHHFAEQALHILRYLAKKWNIEVQIPPPEDTLSSDDLQQLVRPQTSSLNFFAPSVVEDDFMCAWGTGTTGSSSNLGHGLPGPGAADETRTFSSHGHTPNSEQKPPGDAVNQMQGSPPHPRMETGLGAGPMAHSAKSIENPLFWPFPMQGRPMLPSGRLLEEAGFALL